MIPARILEKLVPEPNIRQKYSKRIGRPCRNCGGTLRYGRSYSCVQCTNARSASRKRTPEYKAVEKRAGLRRRYGVTPEQVADVFERQGRQCAICKRLEPGNRNGWALDHCHATGRFRGVLCHGCNTGLGGFKDRPEVLAGAIAYLEGR